MPVEGLIADIATIKGTPLFLPKPKNHIPKNVAKSFPSTSASPSKLPSHPPAQLVRPKLAAKLWMVTGVSDSVMNLVMLPAASYWYVMVVVLDPSAMTVCTKRRKKRKQSQKLSGPCQHEIREKHSENYYGSQDGIKSYPGAGQPSLDARKVFPQARHRPKRHQGPHSSAGNAAPHECQID